MEAAKMEPKATRKCMSTHKTSGGDGVRTISGPLEHHPPEKSARHDFSTKALSGAKKKTFQLVWCRAAFRIVNGTEI